MSCQLHMGTRHTWAKRETRVTRRSAKTPCCPEGLTGTPIESELWSGAPPPHPHPAARWWEWGWGCGGGAPDHSSDSIGVPVTPPTVHGPLIMPSSIDQIVGRDGIHVVVRLTKTKTPAPEAATVCRAARMQGARLQSGGLSVGGRRRGRGFALANHRHRKPSPRHASLALA